MLGIIALVIITVWALEFVLVFWIGRSLTAFPMRTRPLGAGPEG